MMSRNRGDRRRQHQLQCAGETGMEPGVYERPRQSYVENNEPCLAVLANLLAPIVHWQASWKEFKEKQSIGRRSG